MYILICVPQGVDNSYKMLFRQGILNKLGCWYASEHQTLYTISIVPSPQGFKPRVYYYVPYNGKFWW